ncbi:MAG TPA: pirin family protein [Chloroflexia bacterium]|nr:pirin family protein [Chloroflexia bacterium]
MLTDTTKSRSVERVVTSVRTLEGGGFVVTRPFPTRELLDFDPFLMLDELGPVVYKPGEAVGAPDHPHRGFETVTYILDGLNTHRDSQGNSGKLGPGDVQWMTAGAGIVHSEMPADEIMQNGGRVHGFQIWVNLPRRDKMMQPRYQDIPASRIPEARNEDGSVKVRVIAGEALGTKAVIDTRTPIIFLHYTLQPGAHVTQPVPAEYNAFVYIIDGTAQSGDTRAGDGQMVLFAPDGQEVSFSNPADATEPLSVLLLAGVPLNEPVARYGPFVMNTEAEIYQAFRDYQNGKMGSIKARIS